jgi:hypothetical protein
LAQIENDMNPNKLSLSLEGNDELRQAMAGIAPGDEVELEITAMLDESTGEQATFSVTEANVIESESMEEEGEGGETEEEPPMGEGAPMMEGAGPPMAARGAKGKRGGTVAILFGDGAKEE